MRRFLSRCAISAAAFSLFSTQSFAQSVADTVMSYNSVNAPPIYGGGAYSFAGGALGLPSADTGFGDLTPFNGAFAANQIAGVGDGGSLVLHMSAPVRTDGFTLGIHAAVGLYEVPYGSGHSTKPASVYTDPHVATISVSKDGDIWKSLGAINFDIPTNYYALGVTTPSYDTTIGTPANFFQPFIGSLQSFSDKDWPGILQVLDGSAGGKWLDLSTINLPEVNFVKFEVSGTDSKMFVDSVVGIVVPEPTLCVLPALLVLLRRRK